MAPHSVSEPPKPPQPPRTIERAKAEKRRRILESATKIFARKGFPSSRISDIARDAGVADGTVYLYFEGKDDLLISVFQETMGKFLEEGRRIVASTPDPPERIRKLIALHLAVLGRDPDLAAVFQIELRGSRKSLSVLSVDKLSEYFALLAAAIEDGQRAGLFRSDLRPKMVSRILWGAVDEVVTHWILASKPSDLAAAGSIAVELILRGIAAEARR